MDTERHSPRYTAIDLWSPADILDAMPPACAVALDSASTRTVKNRWANAVRPSRRPRRGLLRMRKLLGAIKKPPHAEERLKGASRSTHGANAARR